MYYYLLITNLIYKNSMTVLCLCKCSFPGFGNQNNYSNEKILRATSI